MPIDTIDVLERPSDLTADWLAAALGAPVKDFSLARIGTGQMSECYRLTLTYGGPHGSSGPETVVLKVAASDPSSRQTGLALGLYEREVRFYSDIAPRLGALLTPCYSSAFDPGTGAFHLLLGDAGPAVVGDEIRGATVDQATLALRQLGRVHGPMIGDSIAADAPWLNRGGVVNQAMLAQLYAGFVERYAEVVAPEHLEVCDRLVNCFDAYEAAEAAEERVKGLVHGDYRLDNLLFGQEGAARPLSIVDWQTVDWGPAMTDVAYFLGCALPIQTRRENYDMLLAAYHEGLSPDTSLTMDDVREGVRRRSFFGVMMAIISPMLVERTSRGDEMFLTVLTRHAQHVLDIDAMSTLPHPVNMVPLQPTVQDEGEHPAGVEDLWNESWYFDFVDAEQHVGGWLRLGKYPNMNASWLNGVLCGPAIPTYSLVDFTGAGEVTMELHPGEALSTYRVTMSGRAQAHDDPAAVLRGEPGRPVHMTMDITWTTAGTPYLYRITPRYEIPCTATGTVEVDGHQFNFTAAPGQRDHSWGVRDFRSMDWVWSALHLNDGTHLHAVDLRLPGTPRIGIGYVQRGDAPLMEVQTISSEETFDDNGLPLRTTMTLDPGDVTAVFEPIGHGPMRMELPDGQVIAFARSWGALTTIDGRTGIGWAEWNRN